MPSVTERIRGTLLGLAWGDVCGCPVEGWRAERIRQVFGDFVRLPDDYPLDRLAPLGKKVLKRLRPLGLHSDDTQQALALINVCLGGWSPEVWAGWLVHGQQQKAWRGYGRNFQMAVRQLTKGAPPQQAGAATGGIGAVMRIAPLGALYRDDPPRLAQAVVESSLCTHGDIRAAAFAFAVAHAAARFVMGHSVPEIRAALPGTVAAVEEEWLQGHAEWTIDRTAGHLVSRCLEEFFRDEWEGPEQIRTRIGELARPHLAKGFTRAHPSQGFVLLGGLHGLAMALTEQDDPAGILAEIVRQGFDTDTVAAIAGGLLGARFGIEWVPLQRLRDRERLERYADALVERGAPPEDLDTFVKCEAAWTKEEKKYQKTLVDATPSRES